MSEREIELTIGHRTYRLRVDAGQEPRVRAVAAQFDGFVSKIRSQGGEGMERDRVLVLAALMMSEELASLRAEFEQMKLSTSATNTGLAERLEKLLVLTQ
jgi:cell division protein ZapA (FtsZ GTPase activity inhibitor)